MSAGNERFDRQLRLWGPEGQDAIDACVVVALGISPIISEALESLIAAGVRNVCIVDNTQWSDCRPDSFFLYSESANAAATLPAQTLAAYLKELCTDLSAVVIPMDPRIYLSKVITENGLRFEDSLSIKLADATVVFLAHTGAFEEPQRALEKVLMVTEEKQCKHALGFQVFGHGPLARISAVPSFPYLVYNNREDNSLLELMIDNPFEALQALAMEILPVIVSGGQGKPRSVPFVLILVWLRHQFIEETGRMPTEADRPLLSQKLLELKQADSLDSDCVDQAVSKIYAMFPRSPPLPANLQLVIELKDVLSPGQEQLLARTLETFVEKNGRWPISSQLKDMDSETDLFLRTKQCYAEASRKDEGEFLKLMVEDATTEVNETVSRLRKEGNRAGFSSEVG